MALRLRKDVQKASYYVWFLGAQEAKGLRGSRVLLPVIPKLIEKSKEQEPLKVTLQVSHKGLKIIQGSSKHFIPHGAITCSVQTEDIVACILLLYNPATKCPLHVHAYRCDSESTAEALNDQLRILINRPENQKRFAELETRLGLPAAQVSTAMPSTVLDEPVSTTTVKQMSSRQFDTPRRVESSVGSDTGTSTRESECSEENSPTSPILPTGRAAVLYDSLAAELRAKLNGKSAPLLLPPKDYDTVHRSKGNFAAIELRRCRNLQIVGATNPANPPSKHVISSRGSSGIGSDLAPSPERHEPPSSSDEEWGNHQSSYLESKPLRRNSSAKAKEHFKVESSNMKHKSDPPTYMYPRESSSGPPPRRDTKRFPRSSSREEDGSSREEEVKPIITKQTPLKNRFRDVFNNEDDFVEDLKKKISIDDKRYNYDEEEEEKGHQSSNVSSRYVEHNKRQSSTNRSFGHSDYDHEQTKYRENLTDKQKYREKISVKERYHNDVPYHENSLDRRKYRESSQERAIIKSKYVSQFDFEDDDRYNRRSKREDYRDVPPLVKNVEKPKRYNSREEEQKRRSYLERNPYKEEDSLPYRESIEKMMKSPIMKYKSFDDEQYKIDALERYEENWNREAKYSRQREEIVRNSPVARRIESRQKVIEAKVVSPVSTMQRVSPKDRFQNAKEKFQAMERDRDSKRYSDNSRRSSLEPAVIVTHGNEGWSSEDEEDFKHISRRAFRETNYREEEKYSGLEREPKSSSARIAPSKSLGNLVKGYRHSYVEPRNPLPPRSGRVGLAAVNPY